MAGKPATGSQCSGARQVLAAPGTQASVAMHWDSQRVSPVSLICRQQSNPRGQSDEPRQGTEASRVRVAAGGVAAGTDEMALLAGVAGGAGGALRSSAVEADPVDGPATCGEEQLPTSSVEPSSTGQRECGSDERGMSRIVASPPLAAQAEPAIRKPSAALICQLSTLLTVSAGRYVRICYGGDAGWEPQ